MRFFQASRRPPVLPCCPCWSRLWRRLLQTVRGCPASPGALHNTPGQRGVQTTDKASWPASLLFLSSAPQPDHCSQGGEKDLIILSLSHLSPPGDFLPLSFPSLKAARSGLGLLLISAQDQPSDSLQIHRVWGLRIQPPVGSLCLNDLL